LNHQTKLSYDYFTGHVTLHTDPNSIRTLLAYSDNLDRLTDVRIFDSAGSLSSNTAAKSHTTFSYPNATTVATKRDRDTVDDQVISSQTVYDSFGRPAESQGPDGSTTYTKYDGMGRTAKVSNPGSSTDWTKQYYDQLGRVLSVTTPDSATSTVDYQANSSTGTMLQVTTTDPSQKSRIVAYDALGRIKQASDNPTDNTYTVTYKYDTLDNLTGVTQNGMTNDRTFTYDSVGRLRTAFNPESGTTYYENGSVPGYDKNGNLTYRKDADSRVTKFEYDDINRVLSKSYYQSDGTTLDANTKKVTYSYDTSGCIGCLSGYSTTLSGMTYSYDSLARMSSSIQSTNNATYPTIYYGYNAANLLTSETYPSGMIIQTDYDTAGRPNKVYNQATGAVYASGVTYAAHGAISQDYLNSGTSQISEAYSYNKRLQPLTATAIKGADQLFNLRQSYCSSVTIDDCTTNNGNVQFQLLGAQQAAFTYDAANRLTGATSSAFSRAYTYDNRGNRVQTSYSPGSNTGVPTDAAQYDGNNRIKKTAFPSVDYDAAGNMKAFPTGETAIYDAENRMTAFSTNLTYQYDGEGHRVSRTMGLMTTTYVYDAFGNLAAEYTPGSSATGVQFLVADTLGSVRRVVVGSATTPHDYAPFGDEVTAPTNDGTTLRFTGKERETMGDGTANGLDYFGARYYSGAQGRFTTPDPTFLNILKVISPQRWNFYGYALNNPLKYVDPDGEETIAVYYPGYQVGVHGNFTLPFGHAGVVIVAKDGSTHYFEYGRYHGPMGEVRNTATPSVQRDASGTITPDSMKSLLGTLSASSGKGGETDALVYQTADIEEMVMQAYLEARERQNDEPNRQKYSFFGGHNCGTLICDTFGAAGHPSTPLGFIKSGATPGDVFNMLRWYTQWSQQVSYTPGKPKEKIKSRICFKTEGGKKVCQQ